MSQSQGSLRGLPANKPRHRHVTPTQRTYPSTTARHRLQAFVLPGTDLAFPRSIIMLLHPRKQALMLDRTRKKRGLDVTSRTLQYLGCAKTRSTKATETNKKNSIKFHPPFIVSSAARLPGCQPIHWRDASEFPTLPPGRRMANNARPRRLSSYRHSVRSTGPWRRAFNTDSFRWSRLWAAARLSNVHTQSCVPTRWLRFIAEISPARVLNPGLAFQRSWGGSIGTVAAVLAAALLAPSPRRPRQPVEPPWQW